MWGHSERKIVEYRCQDARDGKAGGRCQQGWGRKLNIEGERKHKQHENCFIKPQ